MNKKILAGTAIFLSLALLFAGGLLFGGLTASQKSVQAETVQSPSSPDPQNNSEKKTITVNAQGVVTVAPDVAYIRLSIMEQMPTAKEASDAVNLKMQDIFKVMEEMGVEKQDLKTLNFNLYPEYDYQSSPPSMYAYRAENRIEIKVHDMAKVGDLLAAALDAGANNVESVTYDLMDKTEAYGEALSLAVQAAQNKAGIMAEASSVKIDPVPRVLAESRNASYGIYNDYMPRIEESKAAGGYAGMADAAAAVALAENQIVITAYVEAAYDIVP